MQQSLQLCCTQVQELTGGYSIGSIFVHAEDLLKSHTDFQKALSWAVGGSRLERYESMMDALFVESYKGFRHSCKDYYEGKGEQLRFYVGLEKIAKMDLMLCRVLAALLVIWSNKEERGQFPRRRAYALHYLRKAITMTN